MADVLARISKAKEAFAALLINKDPDNIQIYLTNITLILNLSSTSN